jgi:hypothetical protein
LSKLDEKRKLIKDRIERKTNPSTLSVILESVQDLRLNRHFKWVDIMVEFNEEVRKCLDKWGWVGAVRLTYHNFARSLLRYCLKYPSNVWGSYIDSSINLYVNVFKADRNCLVDLTECVVNFLKGLMKRIEREAEVGSTGVEADNSK